MLSVRLGGQWLSTIAAYGPVTVEFGLHGFEAAEWQMQPDICHPLLRGNQSALVYDGGFLIGAGRLNEPGRDGSYSVRGIWHEAERTPCITGGGAFTAVADTAISSAVARGDISWSYTSSISSTAWAAANGQYTLAQLLDGVAAELGLRWVVSPNYVVSLVADPTIPTWLVPHAVAGRGLTPAEDEFATHLSTTYLVSAGVTAYAEVGSAAAATVFGRRTVPLDPSLEDMGFISGVRATAVLTGMFLRAGARMGWAEGLELQHGQITNPGGVAAALSQIRALQMIRLCGTIDTSRAQLLRGNTDIVIASSRYTDGSNAITLAPLGYAPRTLGDVLDWENE